MLPEDVKRAVGVTVDDVEASGRAYFENQWDILPPRSKAIYRHAIRRALETYASRITAHLQEKGE